MVSTTLFNPAFAFVGVTTRYWRVDYWYLVGGYGENIVKRTDRSTDIVFYTHPTTGERTQVSNSGPSYWDETFPEGVIAWAIDRYFKPGATMENWPDPYTGNRYRAGTPEENAKVTATRAIVGTAKLSVNMYYMLTPDENGEHDGWDIQCTVHRPAYPGHEIEEPEFMAFTTSRQSHEDALPEVIEQRWSWVQSQYPDRTGWRKGEPYEVDENGDPI